MDEKIDILSLIFGFLFFATPIIFVIMGILMIVFRKTFGNIYYKINQYFGNALKDEKGEPWGLFKMLTPNLFTLKHADRIAHQKRTLLSGIMLLIIGLILVICIIRLAMSYPG